MWNRLSKYKNIKHLVTYCFSAPPTTLASACFVRKRRSTFLQKMRKVLTATVTNVRRKHFQYDGKTSTALKGRKKSSIMFSILNPTPFISVMCAGRYTLCEATVKSCHQDQTWIKRKRTSRFQNYSNSFLSHIYLSVLHKQVFLKHMKKQYL